MLENKVQLMTYPDSLGGDLKNLRKILKKYLSDAVGGVHILPFYPSSGDRGFAPSTHLEVEPSFGEWFDIEKISAKYNLVADLVSGHISTESVFFKDYLEKGDKSAYSDMFLPLNKIFRDGKMTLEELARFSYLQPIPPFINYQFANGSVVPHFKTFLPQQADLDIHSSKTKSILMDFIENLALHGVKMIRLDAIETIIKNREHGYHLAPGTFEILEWFIKEIRNHEMEVLCEIHGGLETKKRIIEMGGWVYDFYLPELIFNAIFRRKTKHLKDWFAIAPKKQIAVLTNHDGIRIGLPGESISEKESKFTINQIFENAGESSRQASGLSSNNVVSDSINATLFEAVFRDQKDWLLAHTIQLFAPGIPQVYYNDLLGQRNDEKMFQKTGEGRAILRHNHISQIDHKFKQPFVKKLIKLMKIRSNYPVFDGKMEILDAPDDILLLKYSEGIHFLTLKIELKKQKIKVEYFDPETQKIKTHRF